MLYAYFAHGATKGELPEGGIGNAMTEKKRRGFSAMDENKKREIARKGGIAAHRIGTAHKFTSEEAREAGRKGGRSAHRQGRATSLLRKKLGPPVAKEAWPPIPPRKFPNQ